YLYTLSNAVVKLSPSGASLQISVAGDQWWNASFILPAPNNVWTKGYYTDLSRAPFSNGNGGVDWGGEGRGCNTIAASMLVTNVVYVGLDLKAIDFTFDQHCEGGTPALHGAVHWDLTEQPPIPAPTAIPDGLWQPPAGATPLFGNYLYIESPSGDWIGQGQTLLLQQTVTQAMNITSNGGYLSFSIGGYNGTLQAMQGLSYLSVGYYPDLQRYPFNNAMRGGMEVDGPGRGCNTLKGWFVVDKVSWSGTTLKSIDARFEQSCDGGPALHGRLRWSSV
ncbi:MAG TPA: hypothetical protein VFF16_05235, partial [Telluria sp.]|nr:hypothetical protein [Telluria sp.]